MASNKIIKVGPVFLSSTLTTDIFKPSTTTGGTNSEGTGTLYAILRHIRITNITATAATFSLWIDTTGGNTAGKEFIGKGHSVAPNSAFDWYGMAKLLSTDIIVGGSGTASALTFMAEGEIGVAG